MRRATILIALIVLVGAAAAPPAGSAVVELVVAARYGSDLRAVAEQVRQEVARDVRRYGGLDRVVVDVHVDDVWA